MPTWLPATLGILAAVAAILVLAGWLAARTVFVDDTWLPTVHLPAAGGQWTPLDDTRAVATLRGSRGIAASVGFRFDADGRWPTATSTRRRRRRPADEESPWM